MTISCNVKIEVRSDIPGVTHVNGNARPQDIDCLLNGAIDYIVTEGYLISRKSNTYET